MLSRSFGSEGMLKENRGSILDVFELAFPKRQSKARFLIGICLVMRLVMVALLWEGKISQTGTDSGQGLVDAFVTHWLQHRPKPLWLLVDPQTSLSKGDFAQFTQYIGIGLAVTPGLIGKSDLQTVGALAASMHNGHHRFRGFSPNQWAFGFDPICDTDDIDSMKINQDHGTVPEQYVRNCQDATDERQGRTDLEARSRNKQMDQVDQHHLSTKKFFTDWRLGQCLEECYVEGKKEKRKRLFTRAQICGSRASGFDWADSPGPRTRYFSHLGGYGFSGLEMCARTTTTFYRSRSHLAHFGEGFKDHQTNFGPTEADHWHCGCFLWTAFFFWRQWTSRRTIPTWFSTTWCRPSTSTRTRWMVWRNAETIRWMDNLIGRTEETSFFGFHFDKERIWGCGYQNLQVETARTYQQQSSTWRATTFDSSSWPTTRLTGTACEEDQKYAATATDRVLWHVRPRRFGFGGNTSSHSGQRPWGGENKEACAGRTRTTRLDCEREEWRNYALKLPVWSLRSWRRSLRGFIQHRQFGPLPTTRLRVHKADSCWTG